MEEQLQVIEAEPDPDLICRRRICSGGCERPVNVCLCHKIPATPLKTNAQIVILQHPHELRQKLATVPLLSKSLLNCHLIIGRKLAPGSSPLLDSLSSAPSSSKPVFFLFPGSEAMPSLDINEWRSSLSDSGLCSDEGCVLIVFDGTWKHAREMMTASLPFLSKFATSVCFSCDFKVDGGSIYDSDLILKKEPFRGCMSTLEAVARALRVLEPHGVEIEAKLVGVLKSMVHLQACHLKPTKPRHKLLRKGLQAQEISQAMIGQ